MFDGAQQFFVLLIASCLGLPVLGWLYIALAANVLYVFLFAATLRAHRQEMAAST
jgi:cytochrome b561